MVGRGIKRPLSRIGSCCPATPGPTNSELDRNMATVRKSTCCRCRGRTASSVRVASVFGLHMLGFVACPCVGFAGSGTHGGFLVDRRKPGEINRGIGDTGSICREYRYRTLALGFRERKGRRRLRYRKCDPNLKSFWFLGATWRGRQGTHHATGLHSAEDGWSLGFLYDRGLLNGGVKIKETVPQNSRSSDKVASQSAPRTATRSEEIRAQDSSYFESTSTAAASEVVAENLTTRFTNAVNRAISKAASPVEMGSQRLEEERRAPPRPEEVKVPPGRKWAGKNWTGGSWRAGGGWAEYRQQTNVPSSGASRSCDVKGETSAQYASVSPPLGRGLALDADVTLMIDATRGFEVVRDVNGTKVGVGEKARDQSIQSIQPIPSPAEWRPCDTLERRSWRVWSGPKRVVAVDAAKGRDVGKTVREELTIYLLATGATHHDVALAAGAMLEADSNLSLTAGTWRRWKKNLDGLRQRGFSGADVAEMLTVYPQLLALDFEAQVNPTMEALRNRLGMRPTDVRRMVRKAPQVLAPRADGTTAADAVDVMQALGMQTRYLKQEALKWPQLLAIPSENFFQLAAFLASEEVGMKAANIGSLLRQAPWLVVERIDGQMLPVVRFLRRVGVFDMERIVRAYPKILSSNVRSDLVPKVRFLLADLGISAEDLPRVLQTFPLVFAVPLGRMRDVADFLVVDLSINSRDVAKIIRAFPSLLGLERERHIDGVVRYLKKLGVQNVGRFVSRLPPVLGYDVDTNLVPKMDFLIEVMGLSVYDVLTFPAYLSYPLETVIEPRTYFLHIRGRPITLVGLNVALQGGDADFARRVAKVNPQVYSYFKEAYKASREDVLSGKASPENLLTMSQRKAIRSLRGQTTTSNVPDMARRRDENTWGEDVGR